MKEGGRLRGRMGIVGLEGWELGVGISACFFLRAST